MQILNVKTTLANLPETLLNNKFREATSSFRKREQQQYTLGLIHQRWHRLSGTSESISGCANNIGKFSIVIAANSGSANEQMAGIFIKATLGNIA